jgi:hypothetical protein
VQFTDGICSRCVHRFRDEHRRFLERRDPATKAPHEASTATATAA